MVRKFMRTTKNIAAGVKRNTEIKWATKTLICITVRRNIKHTAQINKRCSFIWCIKDDSSFQQRTKVSSCCDSLLSDVSPRLLAWRKKVWDPGSSYHDQMILTFLPIMSVTASKCPTLAKWDVTFLDSHQRLLALGALSQITHKKQEAGEQCNSLLCASAAKLLWRTGTLQASCSPPLLTARPSLLMGNTSPQDLRLLNVTG